LPKKVDESINVSEREQLMVLAEKLAMPVLPYPERLEIVGQMRSLLKHEILLS